jgi:hypothetical protein
MESNNEEKNYIIIDRNDPELMWNIALSIIVLFIFILFIFINWKPKCGSTQLYEDLGGLINGSSIQSSLQSLGSDVRLRLI